MCTFAGKAPAGNMRDDFKDLNTRYFNAANRWRHDTNRTFKASFRQRHLVTKLDAKMRLRTLDSYFSAATLYSFFSFSTFSSLALSASNSS